MDKVNQDEIRVAIKSDYDIVLAAQKGRNLAAKMGLSDTRQTEVVIAISEVARNILNYAQNGEILLAPLSQGERTGILIIARDAGPGISDLQLALQDGYSTGKGLGLGLPGARRLMDEFEIISEVAKGTVITMKKWSH